jgi:hypothetical protein
VRCKNETFKANFEGANIQIAVVLTSDSRELKMASIHTDGSVMVHTVQRGSPVKSDEIGELPDPKIRSHAKSSSGNWLVVGTGNYVVKAKGIEECGRAPDKIERVAASGNHIVLSARDGTFWQANLRNLAESARICSALHQTPAVIAVNVEYHLLVIGTLEASILLYSLISGLFRMKVDLPGEIPERILVTDGWGFILVASQSRISLFDVNGKLLRSIGVTINIVAWCTWRDSKGFDFVGLADDNGKIFVCEAFYLEFGDYVAFCRGSVVALEFVNEVIGLTAITSAGSCFLIPIQSPD